MSSREEKIEVKVTGADRGAADLEKMAGTAKVAGESVKGMGREADKASKGVDELGDEAQQTASQLSKLEREVLEAKTALAALGEEYKRTADPKIAEEIDRQGKALTKLEAPMRQVAKISKELAGEDPLKAIAAQASRIDRLASMRKRVASDEAAAHAENAARDLEGALFAKRQRRGGQGLFGSLLNGLDFAGQGALSGATAVGDKLGDMGPMGALKLGVGVSAAPAVLSLAGSALLAGGALAGVGLGVGGAVAGHPEVFQKEWSSAITQVSSRWQAASSGFEKPALEAFGIIRHAVDGIHLEDMLKAAEGYVAPLARGIAGFITPLGNGIAQLTEKAGPVVKVLERDLPMVGQALEKAFSDIGEGSDGAAAALNDLFGYVSLGIRMFGKLVEGGEKLYGALHDLVPLFDDGSKKSGEMTGHLVFMKQSTDNLAESTATAARDLTTLMDEWDKYAGIAVDSTEAAIAFEKAQDDLVAGWHKGAKALDISNEKGRENVQLALDTIKAAQQVRDSAIAAGGGTVQAQAEAQGAYEKTLKSIEDMLVKLGLTRDEAHKFVEEYDGRTVTMNLKVNGTVHWNDEVGISVGNLLHHAGGRSAAAPAGWAVVGERGPELAYFNQGDRVFPAGQSQAMLSAAAAPASGVGSFAPRTVRFAGKLDGAFATAFMQLVRTGLIQID